MAIPNPFTGRTPRSLRRNPRSWGRDNPMLLEELENRSIPSVNIALSGTDFTSVGPAPIFARTFATPDANGNFTAGTSSPGDLPSTGRINDVATQPLARDPLAVREDYSRAVYTPNPNVIYVASAGGGIAKSLDSGATWQHLTDRLTNAELGLPVNASPTVSATRRTTSMGSVAISPRDPNTIYAGEGDEFGGIGHGILRSTDGGTKWQLLQGPASKGFPAFDGVTIPKLVVLRNPEDTTQDLVYAMVQLGSNFLPQLWRNKFSGANDKWELVTSKLTTPLAMGGNGVGFSKDLVTGTEFPDFAPFTDFNVDPTEPNVVYVAVGADDFGQPVVAQYENNGIYKTENALANDPATTKWVVAFGGNGTFVPGSLLGRIEFAVAPSRPSVLYAAIGKGTTKGLLGVFRSQDSGINWVQIPGFNKSPTFVDNQDFYNLAIAVDPLNEAQLYLGGNDFSSGNGPPSNRIVYSPDALNKDTLTVTLKSIAHDGAKFPAEGPHEDIHTFDFDPNGKFLVGCDGGLFRTVTPDDGGPDWENPGVNGTPGSKLIVVGKDPVTGAPITREYPTALNVTQVQGIGLHPFSADIMFAGLQDNGANLFVDDGNLGTPDQAYGWPEVNGGDVGNGIFDFVNPNNVYHIAPVLSYGANNYIQKSADGGRTWAPATTGIGGQANRTQFYPVLEMDPSNSKRLFTGTDNVFETKDGGGAWGSLAGRQLEFVTGIPDSAPGTNPSPTVTAIGVGRQIGNIVYAAVDRRYKQVTGGFIIEGPALYRIDTRMQDPPFKNDPAWRDRSPGRVDTERLAPLEDPIQKVPSPNSLGFFDIITDIAVDPFDSNRVFMTAGAEVWFTADGGQSWITVTRNLPALGGTSIAIDPNRLAGPSDDEVYIGLSAGVWRLRDPDNPMSQWEDIRYNGPIDGNFTPEEFTRYRHDLPDARVTDIEVNTTTGILAVSTDGRGVFQLQIRPLVTGTAFFDVNGNGVRDPFDANGDGTIGPGEFEPGFPNDPADRFPDGLTVVARSGSPTGPEEASVITRGDGFFKGFYEFRSLPDDVYFVSAGIDASTFQQTTDQLVIANVDPTTKALLPINRTNQFLNQDIGVFERTEISGIKFDDLDGDGMQDLGEPGLPGFTIQLHRQDTNEIVRATTTKADGTYTFDRLGVIQVPDPTDKSGKRKNVVPYYVQEVQQPDYVRTRPVVTPLFDGQIRDIRLTSGTPDTNNDFGNFKLFSLFGIKFEDVNGNGARDPFDANGDGKLLPGELEPGLPNWEFRLRDSLDNPIRDAQNQPISTLTDASGKYVFQGLRPIYGPTGKVLDYRVREVLQAGFAQVTADPPDVPVQSGKTVPGGDFGNFRLVTISGAVYDDTNGNGVQEGGENTPVEGGFAVLVNTADSSEVARVSIGVDGAFAFPDRRPLIVGGQLVPYTVRLEPATGFIQTSASPAPFTISSGVSVTGLRFGVFRAVTISGLLYEDINGNGVQDGGETGGLRGAVGSAKLELVAADDGSVVPGSLQLIGPDGKFAITNLGPIIRTPGQSVPYRVRVTGPGGFVITAPNAANPPDADAETNPITLTSGIPVGPLGFGGFKLTEISGQVFNDVNGDGVRNFDDANKNGIFDAGEVFTETGGVKGAKVDLIDTRSGVSITSTLVGTDGKFVFANRGPLLSNNINAPYRVEVTAPAGFELTGTTKYEVVLKSGSPAADRDFPGFQQIAISGKAFNDLNGNGKLDKNEPSLAGQEIQLKNLTTGKSAAAVTDKSGNYSFPNLGPGIYQLTETVMPGFLQTSPNPPNFPAMSGQNIPNQLFANFKLIDVGGRVIEDLNRNGTFEANEKGLGGFTVTLAKNGFVFDTRITDGSGQYVFTGLGPGSYATLVDIPRSFVPTRPGPDEFVAVSGQNSLNNDFGVLRLGSIQSFVYSDNNRNGRQDAREPRLENVQVFLRNQADEIIGKTVSNKNGEFSFFDIEPGNYKVQFLFGPAGSGFSFSNPDFPSGFPITITGGSGTPTNDVKIGLGIANTPTTVTGADKGGGPNVLVIDALTGQRKASFFAYDESFTGGVRVARGDLTGDGVDDYITGVGPTGIPEVRAFNGVTGELLFSFLAYEPTFTGGMFMAAGDVNGDGVADIITGTDVGGGPRVQVFDGKTRQAIRNYFAYESTFRGGVRVAAGDVNGDGLMDIVTTPAEGGGPRVTAFDGRTLNVLSNFFAFDPTDRAGVYVAAGDFTGDDVADILVGQGATDNPLVRIFTSAGVQLASAQAFPPDEFGNTFKSEVRVAVTDRLGDGKLDAVITSGPGSVTRLRFLDANLVPSADEVRPYTDTFTGGVYVG